MKKITSFKALFKRPEPSDGERGQSIVLIALMMIALIGFIGIAVDTGFIFVRQSQLQAAVDSAALAGVVELSGWSTVDTSSEAAALTKSAQFLNANNLPISVTQSINVPGNTFVEKTPLGATEYSVTATWPVETFFLHLLGFEDDINVTKSATAAIYSLADVYVSRRVEDGVLSTSNQGIFGPNICIDYGDPFSPLNSPWQPGSYTYEYRIYIPPDYGHDVVRVELFDPDSMNASLNDVTIARSQTAVNAGQSATDDKTCGSDGGSSNRKNPCLLRTDELDLVTGPPNYDIDQVNPYWFVRIDENRGTGGGNGNGSCGQPGSYTASYNTATLYQLYYFRQNPNGTTQRIDLVSYTGQTGDGGRDFGDHDTDMRWVSPGAAVPFSTVDDPGTSVPVDAGSQLSSFEIDLTQDVPNIITDPGTGARYIYMDVTALSGASENGFEIWAGPPDYVNSVPSEVNNRNLHILNNPGSHSSDGVTVFGLGNLPMNSNFSNPVDIPLVYLGPEYAGETVTVSMFDSDSGAQPPVIFYFDSIAFTPDDSDPLGYDPDATDWAMSFHVSGQDDPDGVAEGVRCQPGSCNTQWINPPYNIIVPGIVDDCDYDNPTMEDCTPFYGGRLTARYDGGFSDTYGWQVSLPGIPYLVR